MMDHLMDIATQQLVTIARAAAYRCDEQHEYMNGAGGTNWFPHKWVVEAMRAAVTIRNTQAEDMVREELHQTRAQLAEAHALLRDIQRSHGVLLMTNPPQDPWLNNRIDERIRAALSASAEPSAPVEIDERAKFETHIGETESQWDLMLVRVDAEHKIHGHPRDIGEYAVPETHAAWKAWQARAALNQDTTNQESTTNE